jgi:PKD repeat protein
VAPLTYAWTFGDGGTSTSQSPSHTYATKGEYTATLTVRDSASQTATGTVGISATVLPPTVTTMQKLGNPFRINVTGSNLQSGVKVFINGSEWTNLQWKSTSLIKIKGGSALKAVVPKNTPTTFRYLNPDGGELVMQWQWP